MHLTTAIRLLDGRGFDAKRFVDVEAACRKVARAAADVAREAAAAEEASEAAAAEDDAGPTLDDLWIEAIKGRPTKKRLVACKMGLHGINRLPHAVFLSKVPELQMMMR
jgi:hypothetical protein